jgi:hypothetical protein
MLPIIILIFMLSACILLLVPLCLKRMGLPKRAARATYFAALIAVACLLFPHWRNHGPGSSGILANGATPTGNRYALVQTYQDFMKEGPSFRGATATFENETATIKYWDTYSSEINIRDLLTNSANTSTSADAYSKKIARHIRKL